MIPLRSRRSGANLFVLLVGLLLCDTLGAFSQSAQLSPPPVELTLMHRVSHPHRVEGFIFSRNGRVVATNEWHSDWKKNPAVVNMKHPAVVNIWNAETWTIKHTFSGKALALSPDGRTVLIGDGNDHAVLLYDTSTGKLKRTLIGFRQSITLSNDGRLMAGMMNDRSTGIWDASTGKRLTVIKGGFLGNAYSFSPNDRFLAISTDNLLAAGVTRIFNISSGKLISSTEGFGESSGPIVFSPDGKTFASAGTDPDWEGCPELPVGYSHGDGCPIDYAFKLWDVATGKLIQSVKGATTPSIPYRPRAFLQGGKKIFYSTEHQFDIRLVPSGTLLQSGLKRSVEVTGPRQRQAVSPDGSQLLEFVGYGDGKTPSFIYVWKIQQ